MSKNILIGPYVGSFKHEMLTFLPYVNYLLSVLEYDDVYISSHYNRKFLYDDIPHSEFIPVYSNITRSELNQKGLIHDEITKQQYNQISKMIKTNIDGGISEHHTLPYIKATKTISYYQKKYKEYTYPDVEMDISKDTIVFIPDTSDESLVVYNSIKDTHNVVVIGDMNNGIAIDNVLLQQYNYFDIVYTHMFNYIHKAKMIVTSCPEWAMICNIQGLPVIYWGEDSSMYKRDGIYGFDNQNIIALKSINSNMVDYMYNKLKEK